MHLHTGLSILDFSGGITKFYTTLFGDAFSKTNRTSDKMPKYHLFLKHKYPSDLWRMVIWGEGVHGAGW